jgi:hypothetical protein
MNKTLAAGIAAIFLGLGIAFTGCSDKGPAEKAGESVDKAGRKLKDAVTPDGPAENAGEKVDSAVKDATH